MTLMFTQNKRIAQRSPSTDRKRETNLPPKYVTVPRGPSEGIKTDRVPGRWDSGTFQLSRKDYTTQQMTGELPGKKRLVPSFSPHSQ